MEFFRKRRNYSEEELELCSRVFKEYLSQEVSAGNAYAAMAEILNELGRMKLQQIEDVLRDDEWPVVILAMPHHVLPNGYSSRTTDDPDREAKYFGYLCGYDPYKTTRAQVVRDVVGCSYWDNYHRLPKAGGAFESIGQVNTFSYN